MSASGIGVEQWTFGQSLALPDSSGNTAGVAYRLLVATDAHTLWFMRTDLNQLLCRRLGERPAFALMAQLTPLFQGAIAPCWISRAPPPRRASARIADPTRQ